MIYVFNDFESLSVGAIDTGDVTSPTLAELDESTIGGSWAFDTTTNEAVPYIRADASALNDQAFSVEALGGGGLNPYAASLSFDNSQLVSDIDDFLEIKFKTATKSSTGYGRNAYWYIREGTTNLVTLRMYDGYISLNGTSIGRVTNASDPYKVNPWNSDQTVASYDLVFDVSVKIYSDGSVDVDFQGTTGLTGATGSKGAGTVSTSANINKFDVSYVITAAKHGIYLGYIQVGEPPSPAPASNQLIPQYKNILHTSNTLWP